jgi:hypothetical protein
MTESWPENVESTQLVVEAVDNLCSELKEQILELVTMKAVSASPGTFIPVLKYMLKELVCRNNKIAFAKKVMTDEFSMNFLFARVNNLNKTNSKTSNLV